jgi:hypothetical protein
VEAVVEGFWAFAERSPDLLLAQYELTVHALRDPELRPLAALQYDRYVEAVGSVLDRVDGAPTGPAREDLARFLVATMDGLVLQGFVHGDRQAARRRLDLCLRSLQDVAPSPISAIA